MFAHIHIIYSLVIGLRLKDEREDYFVALKESIQQLTSTNRVDKKFQMSFSIINIFLL